MHRNIINFDAFYAVPVVLHVGDDPGMPSSIATSAPTNHAVLLSEPLPDQRGLEAVRLLDRIHSLTRAKNKALEHVEQAHMAVLDAVRRVGGGGDTESASSREDPANRSHALFVAEAFRELRSLQDRLAHFHRLFRDCDEDLKQATLALAALHNSRELLFVAQDEEEIRAVAEQMANEERQRQVEDERLTAAAAAANSEPGDSGGQHTQSSSGGGGSTSTKNVDEAALLERLNMETSVLRPFEVLQRLIRAPAHYSRTTAGAAILTLITLLQACYRRLRTRRRYLSLRRARRRFDRATISYQFYFFRRYVAAVRQYRRFLLRSGFYPMLGNANIATLQRGAFAVHYARARSITTMQRIFVLWRQLTRYYAAKVPDDAPPEHWWRREAPFEFHEMEQWHVFLHQEHLRQAMRRIALPVFGGADNAFLTLSHTISRWKSYVRLQRREREACDRAVRHAASVCKAKHFYAWMDILTFTMQRAAQAAAKERLYFGVWRRYVQREKHERRAAAAMVPVKKVQILNRWRQRVVQLRMNRAACNLQLCCFKPLLLQAVCVIAGMSTRGVFLRCWRWWRQFTARRLSFESFIGLRWQRRRRQLQQLVFQAWRAVVRSSAVSSSSGSLWSTAPPTDVAEDLKMLSVRCKLRPMLSAYHQSERALAALATGGVLPTVERTRSVPLERGGRKDVTTQESYQLNPCDLFTKEIGPIPSVAELEKEKMTEMELFHDWVRFHCSTVVLQPPNAQQGGRSSAATDDDPQHQQAAAATDRKPTTAYRATAVRRYDKHTLAVLLQYAWQLHKREAQRRAYERSGTASSAPEINPAAATEMSPVSADASGAPESTPSVLGSGDFASTQAARRQQALAMALAVGFPFASPTTSAEWNVVEMETFFEDCCRFQFVITEKQQRRDDRILRKFSMRLAAIRFADTNPFFTCHSLSARDIGFSPYRHLLEQYTALTQPTKKGGGKKRGSTKSPKAQAAALAGRRPKFMIPLPQVPRNRQLPYLLRGNLHSILQDSPGSTERMLLNRIVRCKMQRVGVFMQLTRLWPTLQETAKKEGLALREAWIGGNKLSPFEDKEFKAGVLAQKMHALVDPTASAGVRRHAVVCNILDISGFNPRFLRGSLQQKTKHIGKKRELMKRTLLGVRGIQSERKSLVPLHQWMRRRAMLERLIDEAEAEAEAAERAAQDAAMREAVEERRRSSMGIVHPTADSPDELQDDVGEQDEAGGIVASPMTTNETPLAAAEGEEEAGPIPTAGSYDEEEEGAQGQPAIAPDVGWIGTREDGPWRWKGYRRLRPPPPLALDVAEAAIQAVLHVSTSPGFSDPADSKRAVETDPVSAAHRALGSVLLKTGEVAEDGEAPYRPTRVASCESLHDAEFTQLRNHLVLAVEETQPSSCPDSPLPRIMDIIPRREPTPVAEVETEAEVVAEVVEIPVTPPAEVLEVEEAEVVEEVVEEEDAVVETPRTRLRRELMEQAALDAAYESESDDDDPSMASARQVRRSNKQPRTLAEREKGRNSVLGRGPPGSKHWAAGAGPSRGREGSMVGGAEEETAASGRAADDELMVSNTDDATVAAFASAALHRDGVQVDANGVVVVDGDGGLGELRGATQLEEGLHRLADGTFRYQDGTRLFTGPPARVVLPTGDVVTAGEGVEGGDVSTDVFHVLPNGRLRLSDGKVVSIQFVQLVGGALRLQQGCFLLADGSVIKMDGKGFRVDGKVRLANGRLVDANRAAVGADGKLMLATEKYLVQTDASGASFRRPSSASSSRSGSTSRRSDSSDSDDADDDGGFQKWSTGGKGAGGSGAISKRRRRKQVYVPRLWVESDDETRVPAMERLVEISGRFNNFLNASTQQQLAHLKAQVVKVINKIVPEARAAKQQATVAAQRIARLRGEAFGDAEASFEAVPESPAEKAVDVPSGTKPAMEMRLQSDAPANAKDRATSSVMPAATVTVTIASSRQRSAGKGASTVKTGEVTVTAGERGESAETAAEGADEKGNYFISPLILRQGFGGGRRELPEAQTVVVDTVPLRRDASGNAALTVEEQLMHRTMTSTADLLNDAFTAGGGTLKDAVEAASTELLSQNPAAQMILRRHVRRYPPTSQVATIPVGSTLGSTAGSASRVVARLHDAVGSGAAVRSTCRPVVQPSPPRSKQGGDGAPETSCVMTLDDRRDAGRADDCDDHADLDRWLDEVTRGLLHPSSHADCLEALRLELATLRRKEQALREVSTANEIPKRRALLDEVYRRVDKVEHALAAAPLRPPLRTTSELFDTAVEKRAFAAPNRLFSQRPASSSTAAGAAASAVQQRRVEPLTAYDAAVGVVPSHFVDVGSATTPVPTAVQVEPLSDLEVGRLVTFLQRAKSTGDQQMRGGGKVQKPPSRK